MKKTLCFKLYVLFSLAIISAYSLNARASGYVSVDGWSGNTLTGQFLLESSPDMENLLCTGQPCLIAICAHTPVAPSYPGCVNPFAATNVSGSTGESVYDLWRRWVETHGSLGPWSATYSTTGEAVGEVACFYFYSHGADANGYYYGTQLPGTLCSNIPPPEVTCSLQGNIELAFGSIREKDITGKITETSSAIECNRPATIRLRMLGNTNTYNEVILGDNLSAVITLDGVNLFDGIEIDTPSGIHPLTIQAALRSSGPVPAGDYRNSSVLLLDVM